MDWFSICLNGCNLVVLSVFHVVFISLLVGKRGKIRHIVVYFFLLCMIQTMSLLKKFPGIISICMEVLALYGVSRYVIRNEQKVSFVSSVLAVYVSQLSFGMVNSIEAIVLSPSIRGTALYLLLILAFFAASVLCVFCYRQVLKFLSFKEKENPCIHILLLSGLFFFSVEEYIMETAYTYVTLKTEPKEHLVLLSLQVLGLCALLCMLYAYGQICKEFQAQAALASLTQAVQAQKTYLAEAQIRYDKTRSFRHDIKNHLSVLNALLNTERVEEAKSYLKKLETASAFLSFPYHTGNPVVDILLGEKLELAKMKGIKSDVSLNLPKTCRIDELDLCVIFANALDNGISACLSVETEKVITIKGELQGDFYRLEFKNTCTPGPLPPAGTGLSNIKAAAEKYHGTVLIEKSDSWFYLHVLLNIS